MRIWVRRCERLWTYRVLQSSVGKSHGDVERACNQGSKPAARNLKIPRKPEQHNCDLDYTSTRADRIPFRVPLIGASRFHSRAIDRRTLPANLVEPPSTNNFLSLHVRGIIASEEQHRLCDMIGFADPPERRGPSDPALSKRLLGFRRWRSPHPRSAYESRPGATTLDPDAARRQFSDAITPAPWRARTGPCWPHTPRSRDLPSTENHRAVQDDRGAVIEMRGAPPAR